MFCRGELIDIPGALSSFLDYVDSFPEDKPFSLWSAVGATPNDLLEFIIDANFRDDEAEEAINVYNAYCAQVEKYVSEKYGHLSFINQEQQFVIYLDTPFLPEEFFEQ